MLKLQQILKFFSISHDHQGCKCTEDLHRLVDVMKTFTDLTPVDVLKTFKKT